MIARIVKIVFFLFELVGSACVLFGTGELPQFAEAVTLLQVGHVGVEVLAMLTLVSASSGAVGSLHNRFGLVLGVRSLVHHSLWHLHLWLQ